MLWWCCWCVVSLDTRFVAISIFFFASGVAWKSQAASSICIKATKHQPYILFSARPLHYFRSLYLTYLVLRVRSHCLSAKFEDNSNTTRLFIGAQAHNSLTMARVYADVNQQMPRAYWDYDSVAITWGMLENYEVVRKIGEFALHSPPISVY